MIGNLNNLLDFLIIKLIKTIDNDLFSRVGYKIEKFITKATTSYGEFIVSCHLFVMNSILNMKQGSLNLYVLIIIFDLKSILIFKNFTPVKSREFFLNLIR